MKLHKYLLLFFCFCSILFLGQSQYDNLPISEKIRIKESKLISFSIARSGFGSNSVILTTGPEQDCNSAIPVCQNVYTTSTSYSGNGSNQEIPGNTCLGSNELNSVWYTFTSSSGGNIAFNITPNVLGQDYDFALYNITGANCSAIGSGALTPVRCNFSATGGVTGLSSSGTNASEPASGPNQSTVLATTAGQTYVLIISNYSSSSNGYTLDFTPGSASIFDVTPPTISGVTAPCGSNSVVFNASEQIKCSTIAANGSDFTITGTGGPYVVSAAAGQNCGVNTAQINLTISPALSGAGPWTVGVTTGSDGNTLLDLCGNAMAPQTKTFTTVSPLATISGPSNVCKGSTFALTASSASSYTWSGVAVPAGQQNQQAITITANVAGTLNFTVIVSNGTCGNSVVTKAVTVTDAPIANFSVIPSLTVCAGTSITFTNISTYPCSSLGLGLNQCNCGSFGCNTTSNQGTFATYLWTFGDGGTAFYLGGNPASNFSPNHTYSSAGTYVVSLNASGLINTCSNTKNLTITVLPATPALTVSPTATICPGQNSTITANGGTTYTWTPGATLNTVSSGTVIASPTITTTYSVSSPGCSGNQTSTVQVVVGGTPPAIGTISGTTTICPNATGITYSVTNVASTSYTWSVPAGAIIVSGAGSNAIIVNFGSAAGTVSVFALGTCGSATAAIAVSLNPALTLTVTPNNTGICAGSSATLTASGATNFTWSPAGTLSSPNGSTVAASPTVSTIYTIIGATGTCTGSATATVTMNSSLTLTLTSNTPTVCPGSSALLDANGAANYTWSPAGTLNTANGSNVTATPLSNTIYTVIGSSGTCTGSATISLGIGACVSSGCNLAAIRSALTSAGNIELLGMNNSCSLYFINPQFMTGPQAQAYAQTFGANLISVQSSSENADLVQALSNQGYSSNVIWIGYSDAVSEGSFVWYDGSPLSYSNWAPGEPNDAGGVEDCTQIYPDGMWNDLNCAGYNSLSVIEVNLCPQVAVSNPPISCPGTNVTLNASTLLGSPGYTYTWVQSASETFTNTSAPGNTDQITVSSFAANTFTVYSEDRYSCPQSAIVSLSVNPSPTITANNATICAGQTATLTATGAVTYSWIPGTGLSATIGAVVTGTPPSSQNYTVIGMDANGCLNGTITAITVNSVPVIGVSPNSTICPQASTALTASGATSYTWSPSSSLSSANGSTVTASPAASTTYTVSGFSGNCIGTNTVSVNVAGGGFPPNVYIIQKNALCDTSVLNWVNVTSVTPSLAQGTLPNGITVNATHSNGGLSTTPSMFSGGSFPTTYSVPIGSTTIRNDLGGTFNFCFSQPVINPQIAFASIGQVGLPITINTSVPYQVVWVGSGMNYVNSTSMIGSEGFTIIRFPGVHTCVSLNYIGDETYCNLAFGVMDAVCQGQPICPGASIELIGNGATTYSWNNGATTTTISPAPLVTTTYSVVGVTPQGCSNTATTTVVVLPTPTITVNNSTICIGQQTATLTANGAATYTWAPPTGLSATTGSVVTGTPVAFQNYTITGTGANGCINDTTANIVVNQLPNITVNSSTICLGQQTATLTATGAMTYSWIPGTGLSATTGSMVTGTPAATQNYTVGGMDANGCINGTVTTIVVNPLPTITVNSASICLGQQTATLTATGAGTYSWIPGTGLSSTIGSVVTGTPTSSQNYTVAGIDLNGCINGTTTAITVNTLPLITVNSVSICLGQQTATLTANGASTYSWIPGTGLSATTGSIVTGTPVSTQVYNVGGIDANGCIGITTTTITINPLPVISAPANMTVCPLSANTLTTSGASSYTWSPNIYLNTNTSATVISTPSVTTTYTIDGLTGACTASNVVTIVVNNTVVVNATANTPTICPLGNSNITATGATTYTWSPALTLSAANGSTVSSAPSTSTTYTVIGSTSTCTNSAQVVITVTTNPVISVNSVPPVICSGSASALAASGASTYAWSPGTGLSSTNGSNVNANPNTTSLYNIIGTSPLGCTSFTTITLTVVSTPTLNPFASPNAICAGSTSTLTVFGASSYTWSPGTSISNVNGTPTVATPAFTTTYTIIGTNGVAPYLCAASSTVQVIVKPNPTVTPGPNQTICEGKSGPIYANGAAAYSWIPTTGVMSPNDSVSDAYPQVTTTYTVTGTTNNCSTTATLQIVVNSLPVVYAGVDTTINIDNTITLIGTGSNYNQLGFLPPSDVPLNCNYCPTVTVNPQDYTCYTLEAISVAGCKNTDVVCVAVTKDWDVFIPNAFTPNDDLDNEVFIPMGYGISEIKLTIFDRWGSVIFKSNDETKGWDGKEKGRICAQGVYIYQAEITAMSGAKLRKTGHVTLLGRIK
ncbi:MAG: gliding motility-associated C-terminal domain-containing protein [Burkholderiales bacterium]|nr:gliding motility-associated C-terminal domain-containing protein [Bacteroidia bacterium]